MGEGPRGPPTTEVPPLLPRVVGRERTVVPLTILNGCRPEPRLLGPNLSELRISSPRLSSQSV